MSDTLFPIPLICRACGERSEVAEAEHFASLIADIDNIACRKCGSTELDLDNSDDTQKTADWTDNNDAELHDTPAVSQHVRCSNCFYEFDVTATDPVQPLPTCPNCGSKATSVAGSSLPYKSNPSAGKPPLGNVAVRAARDELREMRKQTAYSVHQMVMGANEKGEEWGVWSDEADDYIAYMGSRIDADEAAARWNRNPALAPDHSQFHDPTMFGTIPAKGSTRYARSQVKKVAEITEGVLRTNPGMRRQAAIALALKTIERYPQMVKQAASRIADEDVEKMRSTIAPLDTADRRKKYLSGDYPRANATNDLDKRYRWDLMWDSGANKHIEGKDYKDAHIDTALRKVVRPLKEASRKVAWKPDHPATPEHVWRHHSYDPKTGFPEVWSQESLDQLHHYDHSYSDFKHVDRGER